MIGNHDIEERGKKPVDGWYLLGLNRRLLKKLDDIFCVIITRTDIPDAQQTVCSLQAR